jgi:SAM-dependent methyltransferase
VNDLAALGRLLGDDARLRILRLLGRERLNVTELTSILGLAQSGVSRHLGLLRDAGLVEERRDAGFAYYQAVRDGENADIWPWLDARLIAHANAITRADDARLLEVLRVRKEQFAHPCAENRELMPGRSWAAWARALGHLLPSVRVGDFACGEGYLTVEAARWAREVVAVDASATALKAARQLARKHDIHNVVWKRGVLEALPLGDATIDVALLAQALHHAADPARALREAHRVLVPGGSLLVLDLRSHDQAWTRDKLGDHWLGFDDEDLRRLIADAGFRDARVDVGAHHRGDPFTVLVASGRRPSVPTNSNTRARVRAGRQA